MREYLSIGNLWKALLLGSAMTVMSIPRIVQGGMPPGPYVPGALFAMTLVSGAATAWGRKGGMVGILADRRRTCSGLALAVGLVLVVTPLYVLWLDPVLYAALEATRNPSMLELRYPSELGGKLALMLWSASFQLMFFTVSGMSFLTRLTGRALISGAMVVLFRVAVGLYQLSEAGVTQGVPLFLVGAAAVTACSCALFARTGLLPAMTLAMGLNLHLFFRSPGV